MASARFLPAPVAAAGRSPGPEGGDTGQWFLTRLRLEQERAAAALPVQQPLPFGDRFLDDQGRFVQAHGTTVGLNRHADASEGLCGPCQAFMDELIAAGFARRLEPGGQR